MTKNEYLSTLDTALRKAGVLDASEIISEYEQHFTMKTADGFSEEEIASRLEKPEVIAAYYESTPSGENASRKSLIIKLAMGVLTIFEAMGFILFLGFIVALGGAALGSIAGGGMMAFQANTLGFFMVPNAPSLTAIILGICLIALGFSFGAGAIVCFSFLRQITKATIRWHAIVTGSTALPPLSWVPQSNSAAKRGLRTVLLISLIVFGVTLVLGFIVAAFQAGAIEFWHVWGWFTS